MSLKWKFLRLPSARVKIRQIPHINFGTTCQLLFLILMTQNSSVTFKLIHFLLWIKGFHQNPNFETFECLVKICQSSHVIFQTTS